MALIAKYIARHRLRETRLLDTIADFLVKKGEYLDSKVAGHSSLENLCHTFKLLLSNSGVATVAILYLFIAAYYWAYSFFMNGYYYT